MVGHEDADKDVLSLYRPGDVNQQDAKEIAEDLKRKIISLDDGISSIHCHHNERVILKL